MPVRKLSRLKFLRIRTSNEEDAIFALGGLLASHIESVIGEWYVPSHAVGRLPAYIESIIAINEEFEEEAIDILRHLSTVERLWKQKMLDGTITELETEYTRSLGEKFEPELRMR